MQDFPPLITAYRPAGETRAASGRIGAPSSGGWQTPDTRSPNRFLWWLLRQQAVPLTVSMLFSALWMTPQFVSPWLTGRAIDEGILAGSPTGVAFWAALLAAMAVLAGVAGVLGHSMIVRTWLLSLYGTTKLVTRKSTQMGHVLGRRTPTGEILSVSGSDSDSFGAFTESLSNLLGAVLGFVVVTVVIMTTSPTLGVVVLVAAPVLLMTALPLLRPLQRRQTVERSRSSELTSMATDIVAGLRILRGIGGERTFGDNYAAQSRRTRAASVSAGMVQSVVEAVSVAASGLFLVLLTWLGAQEVLAGRLTVGELISFFGYAVFMVVPLQTFFRIIQQYVRAGVSARKTIAVFGQQPPWQEPADPRPLDPGAELVDERSGVVVRPGEFTVVVSGVPDDTAALADRLGRYLPRSGEPVVADDDEGERGRAARRRRAERDRRRAEAAARDEQHAEGRWGVRLGDVDLAEASMVQVRSVIMVSDAASGIFAGTVQDNLDPLGRVTRDEAERAITVAAAEDVYTAIPGGWQGRVDERGRGLSGGQRQRLVLARALAADPPILILVEPTSAVDAHTEAMIADRLSAHRAGRTTVATSVSPLLLHHADRVVLLVDGRAVAEGTHDQLLAVEPRYRAVVSRALDDPDPNDPDPNDPDPNDPDPNDPDPNDSDPNDPGPAERPAPSGVAR